MNRRKFTKLLGLLSAGSMLFPAFVVNAKQYLTLEQAQQLLWGDSSMTKLAITLTEEQIAEIREKSGIRVRNSSLQAWKVDSGGWFIVDQVIGKHENIDIAFAYQQDGTFKDFEIMTYRETYGYEVANPKWKKQFHGMDFHQHLKLDHQIINISGATLSCKHITDGINRLNHTWNIVLKDLG